MGSEGNTVMDQTRSEQGQQVANSMAQRRSRQAVPRPRTVRFALTDQEFGELGAAAARAGLAKGAYAAEAALAAARNQATPPDVPLRDALGELIRSAGLVRRIGVNLN